MTSIQKPIVIATIFIVAGTALYQANRDASLRARVQALQSDQAPLVAELQRLKRDLKIFDQNFSALQTDNERLRKDAAELVKLRGDIERGRTSPRVELVSSAGAVADTADTARASEESIGREVGNAIVRGELGAFQKLSEISKATSARLTGKSVGLDETERGEASYLAFSSVRAAFKVIEEAAILNNEFAIDAVVKSLLIPDLQSYGAHTMGVLAGNGNDDALNVLLNQNYGFPLATIVDALQPATERGTQLAVDALVAVSDDPRQQALWYMAATG